MKDSFVQSLSFLPSDADCLEAYLNEKLEEGYRLKWIKAGFASFVKTDYPHFRYAVDQYPNASVISLKRESKIRMGLYNENDWYFLAKTRGNYVFFTDNEEAEYPNFEKDLKIRTIDAESKRNSAIILLIGVLIYFCIRSKAFMYTYVFTNLYMYITLILAFLAGVSFAAIFMYSKQKYRLINKLYTVDTAEALKRGRLYTVRNIGVIALALLCYLFETRHTPLNWVFLLIPIVAMVGGAIFIKKMFNKSPEKDGRKLVPLTYGIGAILLVAVLFSFTSINRLNKENAEKAYAESLANSNTYPVLHYDDFFEGEKTSQCRELNSLLGVNYLFQETDGENTVFSNYSSLSNSAAADAVFSYLFEQAQIDYQGTFELKAADNTYAQLYSIPDKHAYLIRRGNEIILMTLTDGADSADVEAKLIELTTK